MNRSLAERLAGAPRLSAPAAARRRLEALIVAPEAAALAPLVALGRTRDLLLGLADHSPYLWTLATEDPARLARLLARPPHEALEALIAGLTARAEDDEAALMRALRLAKRESALLIALADIGGVWDVVETTEALTRFADAAVGAALAFLLRQNALSGRLALDPDATDLQAGCGLVVLALGKLGARELNYSSDIDLIVLYDPAAAAIPEGVEPAPLLVRITKALARLLQERTPDGYVLRVDLRLRPDPASTPVALSTASAYAYYETVGQNWERAALIKARPAAGDLALGRRFLADLAPFIWRKYFDYAAIADIHAMKRQIHAVRGHERVVVPGHDVKLGRGGIREVEFFVQTQQLIFGGRRPKMRGSRTLDMLSELHAENWVTAEAVKDLTEAYLFLRTVEHRLQMVADEQTQRLPFERAELSRFARFCGYERLEAFAKALTFHLTQVEKHYARLFESAPTLSAAAGNLVFTGVADDPETLATLSRLGFQHPEAAAETIRGWHFGRRPAVRSARAREVLTELTPALLEAFAGSGDADAALAAFDGAMARMSAAVELLSILRSNDDVRELFGDVLGSAPRLAEVIATRPHVLDAAIDPDRTTDFEDSFNEEATRRRAETYVEQARNTEDALDRARDFAAEEMFLIGLHLLSGRLDPDRAGRAYSALAQALVGTMLKQVDGGLRRRPRTRARRPRRGAGDGQARLARNDGGVRPRPDPHLRFPGRRRRVRRAEAARSRGLLFAPHPAPARRADRADPARIALRSRHAAQALGPQGTARHPVLRLRPLPARRGRDLGAHGAHPGARHRRRFGAGERCRQGDPRHADAQARPGGGRPRGDENARPDRQGEGRPRPVGPQARQGRPDGHRVRRAVPQPRLRPFKARDSRRLDAKRRSTRRAGRGCFRLAMSRR